MTIKIGRAAIGQKFYSNDRDHVYEVLDYIPPGQTYKFRGIDRESITHPQGRYVVNSRHGDREGFIDSRGYMSGARAWIAANPLPV